MCQPGVWDTYEEGARILDKYLRTYQSILEARKAAEEVYTQPPVEEEGLRLLTGRFFLTGKAGTDAKAHGQWAQLPYRLNGAALKLLLEIKQKYYPEACLETRPESFDYNTYVALAHHDRWRNLWKMVHGKAQPRDSWLQRLGDYPQSPAEMLQVTLGMDPQRPPHGATGPAKGKGDQEVALARHRAHAEAYNRLRAAFEQHYFREKTAVLLDRLRSLAEKADGIAAEVAAQLAGARATVESVAADLEQVNAATTGYEQQVRALADKAGALRRAVQSIGAHHAAAEKDTVALSKAAAAMEQVSLGICQKTKSVQQTKTREDRQGIYQQILAEKSSLSQGLSRGRRHLAAVKAAARNAARDADRINQLAAGGGRVDGIPAALASVRRTLAVLRDALAKTEAASDRDLDIGPLLAEADLTLKELTAATQPMAETDEGRETLAEADRLLTRMEGASGKSTGLLDTIRGKVETAQSRAAGLESTLSWLQGQYETARSVFAGGEDLVGQGREKAETTAYLLEMAGGSFERIEKAATDGAFCVVLAQDLLKREPAGDRAPPKPQLVQMPNLRGLSYSQAMGLIHQSGLEPQGRVVGKAHREDLAHRVKGQRPGAGTRVAKGSPVRFEYYGDFDVQELLATVDCSRWPGSVPGYDTGAQKVICACGPGTAWNPARTTCINCDAFRNAFNDAISNGNPQRAKALLHEAGGCPWSRQGHQALNAAWRQAAQRERFELQCLEIQNQALAALRNHDLRAASGILARAQRMGCRIDPQLNAAVQREIAWQRQQQQHQQNMENIRRMGELLRGMINPPLDNRQPPRSANPPPRVAPPLRGIEQLPRPCGTGGALRPGGQRRALLTIGKK